MPRQQIRVKFNPSPGNGARFVFEPERAVLNGETRTVDVVLETQGGNGRKARFSEPEGISWAAEGPSDLEKIFNPDRTIVSLQGFPRDTGQEEVNYGYHVSIEYEGATFSSTGQYPVMACVDTGGSG